MDTRYAVQHRTTRTFLACTPSVSPFKETLVEADAASWPTMTQATMELLELADFAGSWDVVPVQVEMFSARHAPQKAEPDDEVDA